MLILTMLIYQLEEFLRKNSKKHLQVQLSIASIQNNFIALVLVIVIGLRLVILIFPSHLNSCLKLENQACREFSAIMEMTSRACSQMRFCHCLISKKKILNYFFFNFLKILFQILKSLRNFNLIKFFDIF